MTPVSASVCPCVPSERGEAAPCSLLPALCSLLPVAPGALAGPRAMGESTGESTGEPAAAG